MKTRPSDIRWYQLPVAWLGIAIFTASLVGCAWMIFLATHYPDEPVPAAEPLFKMPASHELAPRELEHRS